MSAADPASADSRSATGPRVVGTSLADAAHPGPADPPTTMVGTPLRDAAVTPEPGDYRTPSHAGDADPHSPEVVSPGIPDRRPRPEDFVTDSSETM